MSLPRKLVTTKEVSEMLAVSPRTVRNLSYRGLLKRHPSVGKMLFLLEDVEGFADEAAMRK